MGNVISSLLFIGVSSGLFVAGVYAALAAANISTDQNPVLRRIATLLHVAAAIGIGGGAVLLLGFLAITMFGRRFSRRVVAGLSNLLILLAVAGTIVVGSLASSSAIFLDAMNQTNSLGYVNARNAALAGILSALVIFALYFVFVATRGFGKVSFVVSPESEETPLPRAPAQPSTMRRGPMSFRPPTIKEE